MIVDRPRFTVARPEEGNFDARQSRLLIEHLQAMEPKLISALVEQVRGSSECVAVLKFLIDRQLAGTHRKAVLRLN